MSASELETRSFSAAGSPETYAEGVLRICELYLKSPLPFVTGVTGSNLKKRIEAIVSRRTALPLTFGRKAVLAVAGIVAIASPFTVGVVNVPILKAHAQPAYAREAPGTEFAAPSTSEASAAPQQTAQQTAPVNPAAPRVAPQKAVWTPTSNAPKGLLTALEGERHDRFIGRAQAGGIDIVFFGDTATEMWLWPDRGRSVWDQTFGSAKAASFGTQGTRFDSLLWRMQNGELDGYQAKVVVLQALGTGDEPISGANYAAIIAEVRARQPQAKILIFAAFPRGWLRREPWRRMAEANAATVAAIADDKTVFYIDIGDRFFRPDGSHNQEMWTISGPPDAGIHEPAFQVWAEELQPWLNRFVR